MIAEWTIGRDFMKYNLEIYHPEEEMNSILKTKEIRAYAYTTRIHIRLTRKIEKTLLKGLREVAGGTLNAQEKLDTISLVEKIGQRILDRYQLRADKVRTQLAENFWFWVDLPINTTTLQQRIEETREEIRRALTLDLTTELCTKARRRRIVRQQKRRQRRRELHRRRRQQYGTNHYHQETPHRPR